MKSKIYFGSIILAIMIIATNNIVLAQQFVMKIASAGPMSSATLSAPTFFKNAIERQSGGQIKVELFDSAQMGSEHDVFMKVKMGALQAGMTSVFETSRHASPHMLVSMLPFLWTPESFKRFMKSDAYIPFFNSLEKENMIMLGFTNVGYYGFITVNPIRTLEDMKVAGKIRVTEAHAERAIISAFGGTPTVMAWGEVYQSLQQKVIDGVNHAEEFLVAAKLHEPCSYFTDLMHSFPQSCFYVNEKWLKKLPEELKDLVVVNGAAACSAARELSELKRAMALDTMRKSGIEIIKLEPKAMSEFIRAGHKVHTEYEDKIGKEYLNQIYEITEYKVK